MTNVMLPEPVAAYFAAEPQGPAAVALCFTADAQVADEGRTHRGRAAIQAWKAAASRRYRYTVEPLSHSVQDGTQVVTGRVTGEFPGSPADLRFTFRLDGTRISFLGIGS